MIKVLGEPQEEEQTGYQLNEWRGLACRFGLWEESRKRHSESDHRYSVEEKDECNMCLTVALLYSSFSIGEHAYHQEEHHHTGYHQPIQDVVGEPAE